MPTAPPLTLYMPFELAEVAFNMAKLVAAHPARSWRQGYRLLSQFALSGPERVFALTLLRAKKNLWLFRCNQTCYCGDFVVIDRSGGTAQASQRNYVIELKTGERLRPGGGLQLQNWRAALEEIARTMEIILPDAPAELLKGDPTFVLEHLGVSVV